MRADRVEGKRIECFASVFALCKVGPDDTAAILSETQSRAVNVQLAVAEMFIKFQQTWTMFRQAIGEAKLDPRKKDVIISGSENIHPAELEAVFFECASIAEAAIVARSHERWGEVPVAVVVPRAGVSLSR